MHPRRIVLCAHDMQRHRLRVNRKAGTEGERGHDPKGEKIRKRTQPVPCGIPTPYSRVAEPSVGQPAPPAAPPLVMGGRSARQREHNVPGGGVAAPDFALMPRPHDRENTTSREAE